MDAALYTAEYDALFSLNEGFFMAEDVHSSPAKAIAALPDDLYNVTPTSVCVRRWSKSRFSEEGDVVLYDPEIVLLFSTRRAGSYSKERVFEVLSLIQREEAPEAKGISPEFKAGVAKLMSESYGSNELDFWCFKLPFLDRNLPDRSVSPTRRFAEAIELVAAHDAWQDLFDMYREDRPRRIDEIRIFEQQYRAISG